jgi:hypothetical protein
VRETRDATLTPSLMLMPSIQANGVSYFEIPVRLPK